MRGDPPATSTYVDPRFGWMIVVPHAFAVEPFAREGYVRELVTGALIANSEVGTNGRPSLRDAGSDAVALLLFHRIGGEPPRMFGREASFPLSPAELRSAGEGRSRHPGRWLRTSFQANGSEFLLETWVGEEASAGERLALARMLASLRFPSLRPGSVTGHGFFVLGPRQSYPVGSVTRFEGRELPAGGGHRRTFHLVRTPQRFYALAGFCNLLGGYAGCPGCEVRFEASSNEFRCANGARWDRLGRVLVNPDPARLRDDALALLATTVGQDGHVLVSTNSYRLATDEPVSDPGS